MRTEIIERKLYKFEELSEEGKEKAIEKLYDINIDYDWWDSVYEDAKNIGLKIEEFDIDRGAYCKGKFIESAEECAHKIIDDHGESCETYKTAEEYLKQRDIMVNTAEKDENGELIDEYELDNELDDLDREFLKSLCEDYRIMLQHEYEYLTSEEAIKETIEANEYEFTENGELA